MKSLTETEPSAIIQSPPRPAISAHDDIHDDDDDDDDLTLPWRHSIKWPMVMREGMAWGLITMSGVMPSDVNGMSS